MFLIPHARSKHVRSIQQRSASSFSRSCNFLRQPSVPVVDQTKLLTDHVSVSSSHHHQSSSSPHSYLWVRSATGHERQKYHAITITMITVLSSLVVYSKLPSRGSSSRNDYTKSEPQPVSSLRQT